MAKEAAGEESALQSYAPPSDWLGRRNALSWDELLEHPLVVVLGEPGSGKTYELKQQASLISPGCSRFYMRLDELATDGDQFRLGDDDQKRLVDWRATSEKAVFFLDSVDEAKIRQATDFYRALDRFVGLVERRALSRATIVISSRITEWLPTTDGHEVRTRIPQQSASSSTPGNKNNSEENYPLVVQLLPLDEAAVTTYAKARGVIDAQPFLQALEKAHAWELARRPADVNDLLAYWRELGSLGTLTQILSFICESQLKKTSDRERSDMSLERAQSGAQCLAAVTVLCRKFSFQIPGETNVSAQSLDALACLPPDWRNEEIRALLNHALFDGASYGHIRFHHRRLSEFLAARWFEGLMVQGCPVGELEDLLFEARDTKRFLRPSLASLAAWLCAGPARWNTNVRRRVLEVAPEILLRLGDPAMLSVEDRRGLLKALLQKADGREHLWWKHDDATLSRLADPALSEEINELMTAPSSGQTLRELGLEMVIAGRLTECAPAVLTLATAELSKGEVFPTAARALKVVASEDNLRELAFAAEKVERFPARVCVPLCDLLFPKIWTVAQLFRALSRMEPVTRGGFGWDYTLSSHLASVTTHENGLFLLKGLLGHPIQDDGDEDDIEPSPSLRTAVAVSSVMLDWPTLSEEEASCIAEILIGAGRRRYHTGREDTIPARTELHQNLRERYFRIAAERLMKEHKITDARFSSVTIFFDWLKPCGNDLLWILSWLENTVSDSERETSLWWALDVWQQTGRVRADLVRIKQAVMPFPKARKQLRNFLHPGFVAHARAFWYRHIRYRSYRHQWWMARQKAKKPLSKLRTRWDLWYHRDKIQSGEYAGWLVSLASEACGDSHDRQYPSDWSLLEKKRGTKCVRAVKEGCKRVWERYEPPLPHKREPNRGATYGTTAGLAGILILWQEGSLKFSNLPFEDARRATRYALNEFSGVTPWFDDLIHAQPTAVLSVLDECISAEWEFPADTECSNLALNKLYYSGSAAGSLARPLLMERLAQREPTNPQVLQYAIFIIVSSDTAIESLASLAKQRTLAVEASASSFARWMAVWLQADALPAIAKLDSVLGTASNASDAMISICSFLGGRHGYQLAVLPNPSWLKPAAMRQFIPLVHRYIRQEDDINRAGGGAYSPTSRDDAQDFRGGLLERLVATASPEVGLVLQELLSEPLLSHCSDYMRHLLEKHHEQMAEEKPWRASDVRAFATDYEREPQTDSDLFKTGLRRILDLKRWVELGEDSPRREVHSEDNEAGFRDWLRRKLNETARGHVIAPEWEIVGGRPDLRLVIPNAAPVSLELKIADNWTLQELVDGLEKQLVDLYLRDHHARYGIYVLALFNRNRRWEPLGEGLRIDSEQMHAMLRKRAEEIQEMRPDISGLEIVLIHFSSPVIKLRL
ncbi:MAG: hypothetical protein ABIT76_03545 [Chthoniobacterales bacterium]